MRKFQAVATFALMGHKPGGDPLEPRPPERHDSGTDRARLEQLAAKAAKLLLRAIWQRAARMGGDEVLQRFVCQRSVVGNARVLVQLGQGLEAQDALCVDPIGITHPGFDLRYRQLARTRRDRRCRRRRLGGGEVRRVCQLLRPGEPRRVGAAPYVRKARRANHLLKAHQPARGHRRRAFGLDRPRQDHARRT